MSTNATTVPTEVAPKSGVVDGNRFTVAGQAILRYGLVIVVAWIGALKFTSYEAAGIQPLIAHSPFMGWLYGIFSVQGLSNALGTVEIVAALLIATRVWWPRVSAAGSALTAVLFAGTLSLLFTTPGVAEATAGGFPALSVLPGQFLLKDIVLLGAAIWTLGEALTDRRLTR